MTKVALVAFQGEAMCFVHVLLNALDLQQRGLTAKIIIEGLAVKLPADLEKAEHTFHALYLQAKEAGLIEGVCKACSAKMGVLEVNQSLGLPLLADMNGHPSLGRYLQEGYTIITF
ncbi:MAG: cytoplasmic protein [Desulfobacca sp.]|uniref:cytoplasmic protein n=1 Tax=Desulfobacca sp. TaxID=2067990 RepID=UPI00404B53E9